MVAALALIVLHVRSMTLTADTAHPKLDVPFNVTVNIQVAENVASLPDVYLPSFFGAEELGDVRSYTHTRQGTLYRETMTLQAHSRGPLTITPAEMDAIDARDGKPKRFLSNALNLTVEGGPLLNPLQALRTGLVALLVALLAIAAGFVVFAVFVRRKRAEPEAEAETVAAPPEPAVTQPESAALERAFAALRERRDRASVLHLRSVLWHEAGAVPGETLDDLLARPQAASPRVRDLLIAIERAAFTEERDLGRAVDEVLMRAQEGAVA